MGDMLHEELKLTPPSGRWHLSEKPQELDLIFYVDGSSFLRESDGMLTGPPGPSKLIAKRNVSSLLYRLIDSGATERILASLLEVLKLGGAVTDLKSFDRLMEGRLKLFQFPPMGGDVEADEIMALIKWFQPWEGKVIPGLVPWAETTS
jgi:hypothetical protein